MNRTPIVAAAVLLSAAAAMADEYTVQAASGLYADPPPLLSTQNPDGSTVILDRRADEETVAVALPFKFPFFGSLYGSVSVSDNGWLAFVATSVPAPNNPVLGSPDAPNGVVAPLWDSLRTGKGSILTFTKGAAPSRTFVVAWHHVASRRSSLHDDLSFEVLLHEDTGVIEIAYAKNGKWKGLSYTAGIENENGTKAFGGPVLMNANSGQPSADQRFTPKETLVTGTITRVRPVASAAGLGPATESVVVAGADVALVREDVREDSGATIATARTDASGFFTLTARGLDVRPTLAVDLFASGAESFVTDAAGKTWKRRIASGQASGGSRALGAVTPDSGPDPVDPNFGKALNIQQAARKGFDWAGDAVGGTGSENAARRAFTRLEFRWTPGGATASAYAPATSTATARATIADVAVTGSTSTPDAYDDDVVLREYAQHLLANLAAFPGALTAHVWAPSATSPSTVATTAAFLDGFSFWFAAAVQGRKTFFDTIDASHATVFDLEIPKPAANGANVAGAVAASLWDLVDPKSNLNPNDPDYDPYDEFDGSLPTTAYAVFATLDERTFDTTSGDAKLPSGSTSWTMASFFDAWRAKRTAAETSATARQFIHQATLADDTFEPNDRVGEEKAFPKATQKRTGALHNVGDKVEFPVDVGPEGLAVTVTFSNLADQAVVAILDPLTLDPAGAPTPVATGDRTTSPIVARTPTGLAPGTYLVRVTLTSAAAANCTVSVDAPQQLTARISPDEKVDFRFDVGPEGLGVAVNFVDAAIPSAPVEANVSILDSSSKEVASGNRTISPIVARTPKGSASGSYVVRVAWKSGGAADYTLSIDAPKRLPGLVLNAGDEDRFSFKLAATPLAVAVSFQDAAEAEVSILDPATLDVAGNPVVVATSASTKSPVVATTPAGQGQGTYVARVAWKSGTAAHYTLSVFDPPVLDDTLPKAWTVGVPFNQTLTATGGVPPVTFELQGSAVPGLALAGGTRIAGTPTTPGDYLIRVILTDSSGAGPLPADDLSLHVSEALTLPPVFGVRADDPAVDVVVGHGGTGANWTQKALPAAAGAMTLVDGATLRLTGATGAPRSFKISADATVVVGTPLTAAVSTIVVCDPLVSAAGSAVNVANDDRIGFWFDAIADSRVTLNVRFPRSKGAFDFVALVDDHGAAVSLPGGVVKRGDAFALPNFVAPRTARYFLVFKASANFDGTVGSARSRIRPPTRFSGVANVGATSAGVDVPFTAIAGSTLRVVMQSAPTPRAAYPDAIEVLKPDGNRLEPLPSGRVDKAGRRKTVRGIRLPVDGVYVLRIGANAPTAGTLVFEAVIVPPKNGAFALE